MLALYRAGRQTDALEIFQAARRRLVDELGLEPGPGLHDLQRAILEHDPSLGAPRSFLSSSGSRARRRLMVAAVLALTTVVAGVVLSAGAAARRPQLAPGSSGVVAVSPAGRITTATRLVGFPSAATTGAGSVWLADAGDGTVTRIDPSSGGVIGRITVGGDPTRIVSGAGSICVANTDGATVLRINPATETVTQTIRVAYRSAPQRGDGHRHHGREADVAGGQRHQSVGRGSARAVSATAGEHLSSPP